MINHQLSESIADYNQALQNLSQASDLLSLEQVLHILNTRDKIQGFLKEDLSITIEQQKKLIELDKLLKRKSTAIIINHDLPQLRKSFFPDETHWWWYLEQLSPKVNETIYNYKKSLKQLTELLEKVSQGNLNRIPSQLVLDILLIRDRLQQILTEQSPKTREMNRVRGLDRKFKKVIQTFPKNLNSAQRNQLLREWENWREIYKPNQEAWWWFTNIPVYWWDRLDSVWNFIALVLFAINLSLVLELSSRFLGSGSGLGIVGALSQIVTIFLGLIGGGIFTDFGKSIMNKILKKRGIPEHFQQEFKVILGLIILIGFFLIYQILPKIANHYYHQGYNNYYNQKLDNAEEKYKRALSLYPDYPEAHYSLGVLYEDLQQNEQAEIQYNLAVKGGSSLASNNLARLYILSEDPKNYPIVVSLLNKGIDFLKDEKSVDGKDDIYYSLYKNLGWVYLKQGNYDKAKETLEKAIDHAEKSKLGLSKNNASAPCLLAQVKEKIGGIASAKKMLERCSKSKKDFDIPEEPEWIEQAEEKLQQFKQK